MKNQFSPLKSSHKIHYGCQISIQLNPPLNTISPRLITFSGYRNCKREVMHFNRKQTLFCAPNVLNHGGVSFLRRHSIEKNWLFIWSRCTAVLLCSFFYLYHPNCKWGRARCSRDALCVCFVLCMAVCVRNKELWIDFRIFRSIFNQDRERKKRFHIR